MIPGFHDFDLIIVLIVASLIFGPRTTILFVEILKVFLKHHRDN